MYSDASYLDSLTCPSKALNFKRTSFELISKSANFVLLVDSSSLIAVMVTSSNFSYAREIICLRLPIDHSSLHVSAYQVFISARSRTSRFYYKENKNFATWLSNAKGSFCEYFTKTERIWVSYTASRSSANCFRGFQAKLKINGRIWSRRFVVCTSSRSFSVFSSILNTPEVRRVLLWHEHVLRFSMFLIIRQLRYLPSPL